MMKKSERLNQMLRFINQKQQFTLQDLMHEFQISKRTPLRDIASLEQIGAPIYAEYGRYGGYRILHQMQLPPISFNSQEVYALYFAMQALRSFSNLPFQVCFRSIHEKFLNALSERQRVDIERMQNRVSFRHTEQIRESAHLEILLMAAVENKVLKITYQRDRQKDTRHIQPIAINSMKGYWYCQAYDQNKQAYRVFRCDRITSAELTNMEPSEHVNETTIQNAQTLWKPSEKAIPFKCRMSEEGVELFRQQHFPSMKLVQERENMYMVGWCEPHELDFMTKYLASFGKSLKMIEPDFLKERLRQYYQDLLNAI